MRPEREYDPRIRKGIAAWTAGEAAFISALAKSANGWVIAERMTAAVRGLWALTRKTRAEVHGCFKCAHRKTREGNDRPYAIRAAETIAIPDVSHEATGGVNCWALASLLACTL